MGLFNFSTIQKYIYKEDSLKIIYKETLQKKYTIIFDYITKSDLFFFLSLNVHINLKKITIMKYKVTITNIQLVEEIENSWSNNDFRKLLELFDYPDTSTIKDTELKEYLFMAITDFEPNDAASVLLSYKLSEELNEGQIDSLSHEMLLDKISEEYPIIELHSTLYNINQLLYKAYNGTFPNAKATILDFEIVETKGIPQEITKEVVLKSLVHGLTPSALLIRLFEDQLKSEHIFDEAEGILWDLKPTGTNSYQLTTSSYWLDKEDFTSGEFEGEVLIAEEEIE